jgi:aspartate-semialdehyde dehydrogenase
MQGERVTRGRRVVSIVGATGLVGSEIAKILSTRGFPLRKLLLFSSGRSAERRTSILGTRFEVRPFRLEALRGSEICFLAAGGEFSRQHARSIASLGNVVIDNSSTFRMKDDVPLIVPEVNLAEMAKHKGIIANPNCSTIQMVVVLAPLHRAWGLRRVIVSTYQSVSGAGLRACGELAVQARSVLEGEDLPPEVFQHRISFNLIPHIDRFDDCGWTYEERKVMNETRKILGDESIDIVATAVRVPVFRCHSESVYAEFREDVSISEAKRILSESPGVTVVDDPARNRYPMPADCAASDQTFVGRLRSDPRSAKGLCMWVVSDNVRKGAALNAVQIAERLP